MSSYYYLISMCMKTPWRHRWNLCKCVKCGETWFLDHHSPESLTCLHRQYMRNGDVLHLATLEHHHTMLVLLKLGRVTSLQLEEVLAAMRVPFPALSHLQLRSEGETPPVVPDPFLGRYAPRASATSLPELHFISISGIKETTFVHHSPCPSLSLEYSSIRVHFTRCDGHLPLHVDQPQTIFPPIQTAPTPLCPGKPTAISTKSHSPSRSHPVVVPRGQRVFGGSHGPDPRSSSLLENNVLLSTNIRQSTTRSVYQSHTNVLCLRWSTCILFRFGRWYCTSLAAMDTSSRRAHTENSMQPIGLAVSITGATL
jgi:hypothetical protein